MGGSAADTLMGGSAADTVMGASAADTVMGGSAAHTIMGRSAADTVMGGVCCDTVMGDLLLTLLWGNLLPEGHRLCNTLVWGQQFCTTCVALQLWPNHSSHHPNLSKHDGSCSFATAAGPH